MKKLYAVLNMLVIIAMIYWNYHVNTAGLHGNTVASLSQEYDNLFTPAGYAFSIWGLIFLSMLVLGVNQLVMAFRNRDEFGTIRKIGPWLLVVNLGNMSWLWFWLTEQTGASVLVMLVILMALLQIVFRLNMERWDAPLKVIVWIWWPICLYSGWIAVATIANISAYLAKVEWSALFSETQWALIMVVIAGALNLFMIYARNMREFAGVGVWALVAIAVRHWGEIPILQWTALLVAFILLVFIVLHGCKNRHTNPFKKMRKA